MPRVRADGHPRKRLVTVLVLVIVCAFIYLCSRKSGSSPLEYGSKSLKHFGLGGDDNVDESSSKAEGGEYGAIPKTIPVSYRSNEQVLHCSLPVTSNVSSCNETIK